MKPLLTILAFASLLLSCHKNKNSNSLVGTWKSTATFRLSQIDWDAVKPAEATTIIFNNDYTYSIMPPLISSMSPCTGKYRIANSNTVMITSSCQQNPAYEEELGYIISGSTLILDYRTTSSGVKIRYARQ